MKRYLMFILAALLCAGTAQANPLKIGVASEARSMDPFFHNETSTNSVLSNIFEGLTYFDKDLKVYPVLAESWKKEGDRVWIFSLRKAVRFHDGSPFTADDVLFSFDRVKNWDKSGFKSNVNMIESVEKINNYTVKIITKGPYPTLLRKLAAVKMMSKAFCAARTDDQLGLDPMGTGPFKLVSWKKGDSITLAANEGYRDGAPAYSRVIITPLTDNPARVAALLSGEVDIIDRVPIMDVNRIKGRDDFNLFINPGLRLIYLQMDQHREKTPYVKGKNPFLDRRVREAVYLGVNENAIVKSVMKDFAKPAGQMHPEGVVGYDDTIQRPASDPARARKLLAEAGYPKGFEVVLDAPDNRYVNDREIARAVASNLAEIGIRVKVNAMPKAAYFPKTDRLDTSFFMLGWASADGDGSSFLDGITHSYDPEKGYGRYNRGRYSNPEVDALIQKAGVTVDPRERLGYLQAAQQKALVEDISIIPLHFQADLFAAAKRVSFHPRRDSHIYLYDVR